MGLRCYTSQKLSENRNRWQSSTAMGSKRELLKFSKETIGQIGSKDRDPDAHKRNGSNPIPHPF